MNYVVLALTFVYLSCLCFYACDVSARCVDCNVLFVCIREHFYG
jgi:hypothetical protein